LALRDLSANNRGSLLVAKVNLDAANVLPGLGNLDLLEEVDSLTRCPEFLRNYRVLLVENEQLGVEPQNLLHGLNSTVNPERERKNVVLHLLVGELLENRNIDARNIAS